MSAHNSTSDGPRATFSARDAQLPSIVRVNGIYYRVELPGTPSEEPGALPPDLRAGLNLAKAHIYMANCLLSALSGMPRSRRAKLYEEGCHYEAEEPARNVAYLINEIECQNGTEVIRALPLTNKPGLLLRVGSSVAEANAHRAAYAAALQIARESRHGLPFSITRQDLDGLLVAVEDEAWAAVRGGGHEAASAAAHPAAEPRSEERAGARSQNNLSEAEQIILEALGEQTLRGEMIAELAGYAYRTARGHLANLVRRGLLEKTSRGYRKPRSRG